MYVCVCVPGVTQNLIDETRLVPEVRMMEDIKAIAEAGQSLETTGAQGETLVGLCFLNACFCGDVE